MRRVIPKNINVRLEYFELLLQTSDSHRALYSGRQNEAAGRY
jgi:hypothetical protein